MHTKSIKTKLTMLCKILNQDEDTILETALDFWAKQQISKNLEKFIEDFKVLCNEKDLPFDVDVFSDLVNEFWLSGLKLYSAIDSKSYSVGPFYNKYILKLKEKYLKK